MAPPSGRHQLLVLGESGLFSHLFLRQLTVAALSKFVAAATLGSMAWLAHFYRPRHLEQERRQWQIQELGVGLISKLATFLLQIGRLGLGLGTYEYVLSHSNCGRAGHQARNTGHDDLVGRGRCRGYTDNKARSGDNAIVCPEYGGAEPVRFARSDVLPGGVDTKTLLLKVRIWLLLDRQLENQK